MSRGYSWNGWAGYLQQQLHHAQHGRFGQCANQFDTLAVRSQLQARCQCEAVAARQDLVVQSLAGDGISEVQISSVDLKSLAWLGQLYAQGPVTLFHARDAAGRDLAIKSYEKALLQPSHWALLTTETYVSVLLQELMIPRTLFAHTIHEDATHVHLFFDFCQHGDLASYLNSPNTRRLSETKLARHVIAPLLSALIDMHAHGLIHRDIRPENLLIDAQGRLFLADFGLTLDTNRAKPYSAVGSPDYMAPETVALPGGHPDYPHGREGPMVTPKVDVWAVGVLVYTLLAYQHPLWSGEGGRPALGDAIMGANVRAWPANVSEEVRDFVHMALAKDPGDRPSAEGLLMHPWMLKHVQGSGWAELERKLASARGQGAER